MTNKMCQTFNVFSHS